MAQSISVESGAPMLPTSPHVSVSNGADALPAVPYTTVQGLSRALDARDAYTHDHSQRVGFYAATLATSLGMSSEQSGLIRVAGLLHDIGKIGIRDAILLKPGRLTPDEYAVMRRVPELGREIITGAGMPEIAHWVNHVHERCDGKGYPDGLSGDDVPIESRVLYIADALEAMVCPRIYRRPLPLDQVIMELEIHGGTQFDADVSARLVDLVRSGGVIVGERPRLGLPDVA